MSVDQELQQIPEKKTEHLMPILTVVPNRYRPLSITQRRILSRFHSPLSRFGHPVIPVQTLSLHRQQQPVGFVIALSQQLYRLAENR